MFLIIIITNGCLEKMFAIVMIIHWLKYTLNMMLIYNNKMLLRVKDQQKNTCTCMTIDAKQY